MQISDDREAGDAALPDCRPSSVDIGCGVSADEPTIDRWAAAARLRHMQTVHEIGVAWAELPEEMRKAWRDLARAAASEARPVLEAALCNQGLTTVDLAERLRAHVEQYMTRRLGVARMVGSSHPAS
jgi:hypothetical protein